MKRGRTSVENLFNEIGNRGPGRPIFRKFGDLGLCGDFASEEKPKEGFRQGFVAARGFWELCLNLRDGFSTEANSLVCGNIRSKHDGCEQKRKPTSIKYRAIPNQSRQSTHTTRGMECE